MTFAHHSKCLFSVLLVGVCCRRDIQAEDFDRVVFRVEAASGNRVRLDRGSRAGLRPDCDVLLYPAVGPALTATIESAWPDGATVVLPPGAPCIEVGALGEFPAVAVYRRPRAQDVPHHLAERAGSGTELRSVGAIRKIEVRVTASSGGSLFLDQGREAGIQPGDEVLLYPPGEGIVSGTIQTVSRNHSRCAVVFGASSVDIGTRGEVLVPEKRRQLMEMGESDSQKRTSPQVPAHPPWTRPPDKWDQGMPLLAPAYAQEPSERRPRVYGRMFGQYLHTWNFSRSHNQYSLGRIGTDLRIENPFRHGGGLHLDGEFSRRDLLLGGRGNWIDSPGRIDRLSYYWGRGEDDPFRVQFGRFLQHEIPELGILDGAELICRTESGNRIGVSLGAMPEPFPDLKTGDDLQIAVFYRFVFDEEENLSAAVACQKTWHRGNPDRDLVVATLDYSSTDGKFFVHESVLGDFYGSADNLKTDSFEITEAHISGNFRPHPDRGVGIHFAQIRWPQLLRREFLPILVEQMRNDWVVRYGLSTWRELTKTIHLDGRVDHWVDQDRKAGTTWDARVALRDWLFERGEVALSLYDSNGIFTSGLGGRVSLQKHFSSRSADQRSRVSVSVSYDVSEYDSLTDSGGAIQQAVRATLDYQLPSGRSASLFANHWFGARQNSLAVGLFLQKRF